MLTEVVEYGCKTEEKEEAMKSEIKGTNSEGKETGSQINGLDQKEKNIQPEQKEEIKIQKNEERFWNLRNNFKCSNVWIIGMPEGEKEEQARNWKHIWKHKEGKLPKSGKGNRLSGSPRSSESPKEIGPKEAHTKAHHNYITQD